jgi:hypothetical protein
MVKHYRTIHLGTVINVCGHTLFYDKKFGKFNFVNILFHAKNEHCTL